MKYLPLLLPCALLLFCKCATHYNAITLSDSVDTLAPYQIHEGVLCQTAQRIRCKREGRVCEIIELSAPIMVSMAEQEEEWGFFQFPKIGVSNDGTLITSWQMKIDSPESYGIPSKRPSIPMMSKDGGCTWEPQDRAYSCYIKEYNLKYEDSSVLQITTPPTKTIDSYNSFPRPVAKRGTMTCFYLAEELPEDLKGVYLYYDSHGKTTNIHAKVIDPGLLHYSIDNLIPVVWWGDIKELPDNSLIAGVYPCYYLDDNNHVLPSGVSFYQSRDNGCTWDILGKVPLLSWETFDSFKGDGGFTEPTFEVLKDSTLICVMRTGSSSPMYRSFSHDNGKTWTFPEAITPNGVFPHLMLLRNGVLVLVSGRPGIQIRFSFDGTGREWTEPIDMIPFMNDDGTYTRDVSCGYASVLEADDNSFYIVYSNFTTKNEAGEQRKSIWFRKVTVK